MLEARVITGWIERRLPILIQSSTYLIYQIELQTGVWWNSKQTSNQVRNGCPIEFKTEHLIEFETSADPNVPSRPTLPNLFNFCGCGRRGGGRVRTAVRKPPNRCPRAAAPPRPPPRRRPQKLFKEITRLDNRTSENLSNEELKEFTSKTTKNVQQKGQNPRNFEIARNAKKVTECASEGHAAAFLKRRRGVATSRPLLRPRQPLRLRPPQRRGGRHGRGRRRKNV